MTHNPDHIGAPTLRLENVTVEYPDGTGVLRAADHVALTANKGELVALSGPSGSGKSTVLSVAAGLLQPSTGSVHINGTDMYGLSGREREIFRVKNIGFVFQQPNLLPALTAQEQLELVPLLQGAGESANSRRERAADLLDSVGLGSQLNRRPAQLSGGQKQRVNIARALMANPDVLLIDEPTSALDHERSELIMDLLANLVHERDVAAILVTHDRSQLGHCDRVVEIADGRIRTAEPDLT